MTQNIAEVCVLVETVFLWGRWWRGGGGYTLNREANGRYQAPPLAYCCNCKHRGETEDLEASLQVRGPPKALR